MNRNLTEAELDQVYRWIDEIPLSRPKRNMPRDFSDAILMAEIIAHFNPKAVQLHNYIQTGAVSQKILNWDLLNEKALKKMRINLSKDDVKDLANAEPNIIEKLVWELKKVIGMTPAASTTGNISKASRISFGVRQEPKEWTLKQIKKIKDVREVLQAKEKSVQIMKEQIGLLLAKQEGLQQILKAKDRQIQDLVLRIKQEKLV